jgi:hypothetical protein
LPLSFNDVVLVFINGNSNHSKFYFKTFQQQIQKSSKPIFSDFIRKEERKSESEGEESPNSSNSDQENLMSIEYFEIELKKVSLEDGKQKGGSYLIIFLRKISNIIKHQQKVID